MPLPDALAQWNRVLFNRIIGPIAPRLPPLAVVEHIGRRSGRAYATPVMAFRDADGWLFALTYGAERDWIKNVLAAGQLTIVRRGRRIALTNPQRIDGAETRRRLPLIVRAILRVLRVDQFLTATEAQPSQQTGRVLWWRGG